VRSRASARRKDLNAVYSWLKTGPVALLAELVLVGLGLLQTHLLPWQTLDCGITAPSWASVVVWVALLVGTGAMMLRVLRWVRSIDEALPAGAPLRRLGVASLAIIAVLLVVAATILTGGDVVAAMGIGCVGA
jgi:hypothetical protein